MNRRAKRPIVQMHFTIFPDGTTRSPAFGGGGSTIKIEPVDNEISIVETRTFPRVAKLARGVANLADVHKLKDFQKQAMRIATLPKSFHTKLEMIELDIFVGGTINWAQRVKSECRENSVPLRQFYIDYKYHMLREVGYEFLEGEEGVMNEINAKISELEEMSELEEGDKWFISKDRIKEFISSFLLKQLEQETNRI
ncbi:Protein CBG21075 [Caenorhabditis briggsae]|uniref:Protein CBG21075 n=1 Tax=Caenorhabditis briggsae TaxID=6238 RepID=A8XZ93_CAEBR|nr:Protein CBG21075 [Caenorhabditis briggsae]CAP37960.2 Protein CBG21075 [Caenorhabditis briggsae]